MPKPVDVIVLPEDDYLSEQQHEIREEGVEIPFERIDPATLRNLVSEFVTREWEEVGDASASLDTKIDQVLRQLAEKRAKVVFDLKSETCNIVPAK